MRKSVMISAFSSTLNGTLLYLLCAWTSKETLRSHYSMQHKRRPAYPIPLRALHQRCTGVSCELPFLSGTYQDHPALLYKRHYLIVTFAPTSDIFSAILSASSLETPSLIGEGASSTTAFAS